MALPKTDIPIPFEIVDREMARVLAERTEAERLQIGWGMWRSARRMIARIVAGEFPELSEQERQREVANRLSHGLVVLLRQAEKTNAFQCSTSCSKSVISFGVKLKRR